MPERLQKLLAQAGIASRRKSEDWLRAGRVTVNGRVASLGDRADPERDRIEVDGQPLAREEAVYWILHKPPGVLSTVSDPHAASDGRRTVLELLPPRAHRSRIYPVGRLDADSEGLLLLTNDGAASQALLHPSLGTEKEYRVTVKGRVVDESVSRLRTGVVLDDGPTAPCQVRGVRFDAERRTTTLTLVMREGRKRQIRRAMRALGHTVLRLVRVRMGPIVLRGLKPGQSRPLRPDERHALERFVGTRGKRPATRAAGPRKAPRKRR